MSQDEIAAVERDIARYKAARERMAQSKEGPMRDRGLADLDGVLTFLESLRRTLRGEEPAEPGILTYYREEVRKARGE